MGLFGSKHKETVTLPVKGMTCDHCVASVTRALTGVDGVSKTAVSLEQHNATIEFDSRKADVASLQAAVKSAGYQLIDPEAPANPLELLPA